MRYHFSFVGGDLRMPVLQPAISKHCETTDTGWCITRYACLLSQLVKYSFQSAQRAGSGCVGLGAWFCAEVVYPSKDGHPPRHTPGLAYSNYVDGVQRVTSTLICTPNMYCYQSVIINQHLAQISIYLDC